jgi:undecaprenyl-diphosphatase
MTFIHLLQAVALGIVQGITEFLPVSSTGHLVIAESILHVDQTTYGLSFDMFTNIGTTAALIYFFRKDLWDIAKKLRLPSSAKPLTKDEHVPWWILGVTIIVGIAGFLLEDTISTTFRTLPLIAAALILFGIVMLIAEKVSKQRETHKELTALEAYGIGLAQILAFIPGVSRSGATISTGLFLGIERSQAARFSFLLSAPITAAAIAKRLITTIHEFSKTGLSADVATFYLLGALAAGIAGYYSIRFLITYLQKYSLAAFVYYRIALGVLIIAYLLLK